MTSSIARTSRLGPVAFILAVLGLGLSGAAHASDECEEDAECGEGYECVLSSFCPSNRESSSVECEEEELTERKCSLRRIPCESSEECPEGWDCMHPAGSMCSSEDDNCDQDEPGEDTGLCIPPSDSPPLGEVENTRSGCQAAGGAALPGALALLLFGLGLGRRRR
jgi:MYXO-CTERM domain-containing protein